MNKQQKFGFGRRSLSNLGLCEKRHLLNLYLSAASRDRRGIFRPTPTRNSLPGPLQAGRFIPLPRLPRLGSAEHTPLLAAAATPSPSRGAGAGGGPWPSTSWPSQSEEKRSWPTGRTKPVAARSCFPLLQTDAKLLTNVQVGVPPQVRWGEKGPRGGAHSRSRTRCRSYRAPTARPDSQPPGRAPSDGRDGGGGSRGGRARRAWLGRRRQGERAPHLGSQSRRRRQESRFGAGKAPRLAAAVHHGAPAAPPTGGGEGRAAEAPGPPARSLVRPLAAAAASPLRLPREGRRQRRTRPAPRLPSCPPPPRPRLGIPSGRREGRAGARCCYGGRSFPARSRGAPQAALAPSRGALCRCSEALCRRGWHRPPQAEVLQDREGRLPSDGVRSPAPLLTWPRGFGLTLPPRRPPSLPASLGRRSSCGPFPGASREQRAPAGPALKGLEGGQPRTAPGGR